VTAVTDPNQFLDLIEQHKRILYKVAASYCERREDRHDLVQEIVMQLWRSFRNYDGGSRFSTWMYRVAINTAISLYRGGTPARNTLSLEDPLVDFSAADALLDASRDDVHSLHQLLARLDAIDRAIITLYLEGHEHEQIAEIIGISATNVATRINRAKQKLQRLYQAA